MVFTSITIFMQNIKIIVHFPKPTEMPVCLHQYMPYNLLLHDKYKSTEDHLFET